MIQIEEHALAVLLDVAETQISQYDDDKEYQAVVEKSIKVLQPIWVKEVTQRLMNQTV
jgi:hypothetical protein